MDSLLCDEVWLSSSASPGCCNANHSSNIESCNRSLYTTKEDYEQAVFIFLEKELNFMPKPEYIEYLVSKDLIFLRFRAIQWLIKSRTRLNLSTETVFVAANYLDRFICAKQCQEWHYWMVELLSAACLSVASKLVETSAPSLHEIQMEDLDHSFQAIKIQQMELILSQELGWRLGAVTAYSYVQSLVMTIGSLESNLHKDLAAQVTKLLLGAILDCKFLEYRPSTVAMSALWCSLEELVPSNLSSQLVCAMNLFNQDQKEDIVKCYNTMQARILLDQIDNLVPCGKSCYGPSSPVTVLLTERNEIYDCHVSQPLFRDISGISKINHEQTKRKREHQEKDC
ncbi:hypothetical protein K2173_001891 [Erythroxylum novogranatense]|uniref:B-like cyclin n=1 Tax=Erythroxylum novogranatense TaxID=1862640 RepID=A0AAV8SPT9_9ROSI|nr:hypothetical protein K2173_001891 [Erythroxylum novogranatense]